MNVIFAAAGTGGHINPALAIAKKICEKIPGSKIVFFGTYRGMENDLIPKAGYQLERIEAWGFKKEISFTNLKHIIQTMHSKKAVAAFMREFKPDIVIGTGGYICGPVIQAALDLGIPTMLHESNAYPGKAVSTFAPKVDVVLTGFEKTIRKLPARTKKAVCTGTPTNIKKEDLSFEKRNDILMRMGCYVNLPTVLVFGGSQGAQSINEAVSGLIANKMNKNYQIVWATGPSQYQKIKDNFAAKGLDIDHIENAKIVPYLYNMDELMNVCDLMVCRSGAMTCTEIAIVEKPAIFVPLPSFNANRQEENARVLESFGAAKVILNDRLNWKNLSEAIDSVILDKNKLVQMGRNAKRIAMYDVEDKIFHEIVEILGLDEEEKKKEQKNIG